MKAYRRSVEVFSMSFLDVISCGFGAIILLLVLSLALEPLNLDRISSDLNSEKETLEHDRKQLAAESKVLQRQLNEKKDALRIYQQNLDQMKNKYAIILENNADAETKAQSQALIKEELKVVLQTLTEEMKNLLGEMEYKAPNKDSVIGGIPVDSEYIIFIIDTSGSMQRMAWPMVVKKVEEVLNVYPGVKGLQVVNDMGHYMFSAYAGSWIPDTPARRKEVVRKLRSWNSFSNSSPVEGIKHAIRGYFKKSARISLYVFGDDFSSGSVDAVLREVSRINKKNSLGETRVRIHAFGFPVLFGSPKYAANRSRFAHLMRLLAEQNSGSFVGLTELN